MKLKWLMITTLSLIASIAFSQGGFGVMNQTFINTPQVGVMIENVTGTTLRRAQVSKDSLENKYCRFTAIQARDWTGQSNAYNTFTGVGLIPHVVLDVGAQAGDLAPWITATTPFNLSELAVMVEDLFDTYPEIKILVLDNEELQDVYHISGRLFQYIDIAEVVQPICKRHGVKLANGGFGDFYAINGFTFRYIKAKYGQSAADDFGEVVFISNTQYQVANDPNDYSTPTKAALQTRILECDTVVGSDYFDYLNFHMYEVIGEQTSGDDTVTIPKTLQWRYYAEAFSYGNPDRLRKPICNETGQRSNEQPSLVTNMLNTFWRLRLLVADWWSGNGTALDARPLTENDGTVKPNGAALRTFVRRYKGIYGSP